MDPQQVRLSIDEDIAEIQMLLAVVIRPVVRDRLLQLLHALQQSKLQLTHGVNQQMNGVGNLAYPRDFAADFPSSISLNDEAAAVPDQQAMSKYHDYQAELHSETALSPYDPVWAAPPSTAPKTSAGFSLSTGQRLSTLYGPNSQAALNALALRGPAGDMQAMLNHPGSVLPALRFGMNLQMVHQQPQLPVEAPFRILTTCSWEQNAYTVKIYVPLQGVKTDLLRAVFQPDTLHIKAINLQGKNYIYSIKQTYRPVNPEGCSVIASKTKKNILITIAKANSVTQEEKHWQDLER